MDDQGQDIRDRARLEDAESRIDPHQLLCKRCSARDEQE